jgi:hypothetical protein
MVGLDGEAALLLGIEYVTLGKRDGINGINFDEEIVPIPDENVEAVYNAVRKELKEVRLAELSEKDVEKLQKEIVMGSIYYADYENSFGVNEHEVAAYADGYLEVEDEYETFYDYIQSVEWID